LISRLFSDKRILTLLEHPQLEGFALEVLSLQSKDYDMLIQLKQDKKEFLRKIVASSSPSFGRFMSQAFLLYEQAKMEGKYQKRMVRSEIESRIEKILSGDIKNISTYELTFLAYQIEKAFKHSHPK
jgi:hypothetical protein